MISPRHASLIVALVLGAFLSLAPPAWTDSPRLSFSSSGQGEPTIVFLHAHPDDESTQTSGSMARASAEGDRVVVVYATNGDHGDAPEDLAEGETVVARRRAEAEASARATGTQRVVWLGYADSGMTETAMPASTAEAMTVQDQLVKST